MAKLIKHYPEKGRRLTVYFKKTDAAIPFDYELMLLVRRAIAATLRFEGVRGDAEVSFTMCDNAVIKKLNCQFRNKNAATDVLSFPLEEGDFEDCASPRVLGDIVVSYERAKAQAEELQHTTEREIAFLTVHSVLHLLGYDHELSQEDDEDMCRRQKAIVNCLFG